jgi:hypothetical protein
VSKWRLPSKAWLLEIRVHGPQTVHERVYCVKECSSLTGYRKETTTRRGKRQCKFRATYNRGFRALK